jgi:ectoine hydroxylase-related dioxygenase (phytanoyl-CoA dioxygenase family)
MRNRWSRPSIPFLDKIPTSTSRTSCRLVAPSGGYVRQSFLDIHDYARFPQFSRAARNIFCAPALMEALRRIAGFETFSLMQTMLFDLNTATPAHQDWYYLDSVPSGNLIAAWIALEDIDERAGRFFVLPSSQAQDFGAKNAGRTHSEWFGIRAQCTDRCPLKMKPIRANP